MRALPASHIDRRARDEACAVGSQKRDEAGNLLRLAEAFERHNLRRLRHELLQRDVGRAARVRTFDLIGVHQPDIDRVHQDFPVR